MRSVMLWRRRVKMWCQTVRSAILCRQTHREIGHVVTSERERKREIGHVVTSERNICQVVTSQRERYISALLWRQRERSASKRERERERERERAAEALCSALLSNLWLVGNSGNNWKANRVRREQFVLMISWQIAFKQVEIGNEKIYFFSSAQQIMATFSLYWQWWIYLTPHWKLNMWEFNKWIVWAIK